LRGPMRSPGITVHLSYKDGLKTKTPEVFFGF